MRGDELHVLLHIDPAAYLQSKLSKMPTWSYYSLLKTLQWLPIIFRIKFNCLYGLQHGSRLPFQSNLSLLLIDYYTAALY